MPGPIVFNKLAILSVAFAVACVIVLSTTFAHHEGSQKVVEKIKESAKETANHICNNDRPVFGNPTMRESFLRLYEEIRYPIEASTYTDPSGKIHEVKEDAPWWSEPLRKEVLIVDIDTRVPNGKNELLNKDRLDWESMKAGTGGMVSASFMNHFLYAQIHGYDYKFFNAQAMEGLHNTWVKPHVLAEFLQSYKFVVFIDADATVRNLELPLEWLFNHWGITRETSIAMPLDTRQRIEGNDYASHDSKGKLSLNTGVIIAQALPHTFEMLKAWKDCPTGVQYPGCTEWAENWSHEQRAFSEYIRYDYNPNGTNIIELPCNDAMGYPGVAEHKHIFSKCHGQFIRHHTIDKSWTKKSAEAAMVQSLTDLVQKEFLSHKDTYWIKEAKKKKGEGKGKRELS